MPKYTVISIIGASTSEEVEAATPEEAYEKADSHASLCHHCARDLELGDPYEWIVLDENGDEVFKA